MRRRLSFRTSYGRRRHQSALSSGVATSRHIQTDRLRNTFVQASKADSALALREAPVYAVGSARANAAVVHEYLEGGVHARRLVGPPPAGLRCHVSPFGVIPKPHQPGKWRLIVNLSAPDGLSVNDGISPELSSVHYTRVDDAALLVLAAGRNARLAKLDLTSAYRMVPEHPANRPLLAVRWREEVWLDAALPFGLRSAPKIFSAVADALQWIMLERGVAMGINYLDDFLFVGRADTSECGDSLRIALEACRDLGMPVAMHKVGGPATVLDFLGIEIDSARGELRLQPAKLGRLRAKLAEAIDTMVEGMDKARAAVTDWSATSCSDRHNAGTGLSAPAHQPVADPQTAAPPGPF